MDDLKFTFYNNDKLTIQGKSNSEEIFQNIVDIINYKEDTKENKNKKTSNIEDDNPIKNNFKKDINKIKIHNIDEIIDKIEEYGFTFEIIDSSDGSWIAKKNDLKIKYINNNLLKITGPEEKKEKYKRILKNQKLNQNNRCWRNMLDENQWYKFLKKLFTPN